MNLRILFMVCSLINVCFFPLAAHSQQRQQELEKQKVQESLSLLQEEEERPDFSNLFRGNSRQRRKRKRKPKREKHKIEGSKSNIIAGIQPYFDNDTYNDIEYDQEYVHATTSSGSNNQDSSQGRIQVSPNLWHEQQITVQLFASGKESKLLTFQQNLSDQPRLGYFYGTLMDNYNNGIYNDDVPTNYIRLIQTNVTQNNIVVVIGTVHVNGMLYQIRQLPNGAITVYGQSDDDFDEELGFGDNEFEDDEFILDYATTSSSNKQVELEPLLEVDYEYLINRQQIMNTTYNDDGQQRHLQQQQSWYDDGSQLDILVCTMNSSFCLCEPQR